MRCNYCKMLEGNLRNGGPVIEPENDLCKCECEECGTKENLFYYDDHRDLLFCEECEQKRIEQM